MDDLLARFLPQFCDAAKGRIAAAKACIADVEAGAATLASEFHTMAGEAAMLGLSDFADVARTGETTARAIGSPEGKNAAVICARALRTLSRKLEELQKKADTNTNVAANTTSQESAGRNQRVLIVDDSPISAGLLCDALEEQGIEAETTDDEKFGIEILGKFNPALVVTDVQMPNLDCKSVCDLVKISDNGVAVLLVSGLSDGELKERAKTAGAHGFISKGGGLDPVVDRVKKLLAEAAR